MAFMENVIALCAEKGITLSELAVSVGFSASSATGWKRGAALRATTKYKIANFFGLTVEEVESLQKNKPAVSGELELLKSIMEGLTPEGRQRVIDHARLLQLAEQNQSGKP